MPLVWFHLNFQETPRFQVYFCLNAFLISFSKPFIFVFEFLMFDQINFLHPGCNLRFNLIIPQLSRNLNISGLLNSYVVFIVGITFHSLQNILLMKIGYQSLSLKAYGGLLIFVFFTCITQIAWFQTKLPLLSYSVLEFQKKGSNFFPKRCPPTIPEKMMQLIWFHLNFQGTSRFQV